MQVRGALAFVSAMKNPLTELGAGSVRAGARVNEERIERQKPGRTPLTSIAPRIV